MPNPSLKHATLPNGTTYDIVDEEARERIAELENYTEYLGVTSTPIVDGATTNPITVNGQSVTAEHGNIVNYGNKEFIFNTKVDPAAWQEFGDLSGLGSLAFKSSATGGVIGTAVSLSNTDIKEVDSVGQMPTFTVQNETLIITSGTAPTTKTTSVATGVASVTQGTVTVS